jgi:nucleoside-diphosphate-sugar epimerase
VRVVVTGGAGRLGRAVIAELVARDHEVCSVDTSADVPVGARPVLADLRDVGEVYAVLAGVRPERIVHLAAIAVPFSATEPRTYRTNTQMAFNVCQAAVDLGVGGVVVASSPTIVGYGNPRGWSPEYLPIDEQHPLAPWHAYALSKQACEDTMRMFVRQVGERVCFAAIRPCYVVGQAEWEGAPTQQGHTMLERLDQLELAAASLFNYVDARDAADLVALLVAHPDEVPNGQVLYVGASDALARAPLAELLPRFHPGTAGHASVLTGDQPAFSTQAAQRLLGWKPRYSWRTELRVGASASEPASGDLQ